MCGRYASFRENQDLADAFAITLFDVDDTWEPSWNIAPTDEVRMVVERPAEGVVTRQLRSARWGLVPGWAKDPAMASKTFNARWETVAEKPTFRKALAVRRCLVPADGYYEWRKPDRQPFYIHPGDGSVLAFAGLYEFWKAGPDAPWLVTTTILTRPSSGHLEQVHDRMPVMPPPDAWEAWLDPTQTDPVAALGAVDAQRADLEMTPVGRAVGNVANNGPGLIMAEPD